VSGPAAGHARMRTVADPEGRTVIGTYGNCAGGLTPWGTYLTAEENFDFAFSGELAAGHAETINHRRFGVVRDDGKPTQPGQGKLSWAAFDPRFDVGRDPNEANRFGWIVEIDALDPNAQGFEAECIEGRSLGFDGKTLIHPNQIDIATRIYSPNARDIEEAEALIAAATGGAERYRDRMIEEMHVDAAKALLARRRPAGHRGQPR
ncbi:DUF839 domain-containing protein, partial [Escherichia coli]